MSDSDDNSDIQNWVDTVILSIGDYLVSVNNTFRSVFRDYHPHLHSHDLEVKWKTIALGLRPLVGESQELARQVSALVQEANKTILRSNNWEQKNLERVTNELDEFASRAAEVSKKFGKLQTATKEFWKGKDGVFSSLVTPAQKSGGKPSAPASAPTQVTAPVKSSVSNSQVAGQKSLEGKNPNVEDAVWKNLIEPATDNLGLFARLWQLISEDINEIKHHITAVGVESDGGEKKKDEIKVLEEHLARVEKVATKFADEARAL